MTPTEERRPRGMERRYRGGIFFPLMLIAAGIVLLLNNLGITQLRFMDVVARVWPLLIISMGLDLALRRNGIITPLLLTGVGIAALLATLGVWQWDIYGFAIRFWPILIIAVGIDIFLAKPRSVGALIGTIPGLIGIAFLAWFLGAADFSGGPLETRRISQPLGGAQSANVRIEAGTARLRLAPLRQPGQLIEGTVTVREGGEFRDTLTTSGGVADYRLSSGGMGAVRWGGNGDQDWPWDLRIARDVPIDLDLSIAAGTVDVDLTGTQVRSLRVNGAFGSVSLTLPAGRSMDVDIENAFGSLTLTVPEGVAVRVRSNTVLGSTDVPPGFARQGDGVYVSDNYDSATTRVEVSVDQVFGSVQIRRSLG